MTRRPWQTTFTVLALFAASVVLTGCPKKPAPQAGTGPGGGAGPTVSGGSRQRGERCGRGRQRGTRRRRRHDGQRPGHRPAAWARGGRPGTGAGRRARPGPGGAGGAGATGTTIPSLPSPKEFVESAALRDVYFDFDRYEIRAGDKGTLDENAKWLKTNQGALLLIEGHADERGTNEYNLALGERRAKATRDYLVSVGIDAGRITVISYGEERPTCTDKTEACWAKNRRAHFLVKQ